MTNTDNQTEAAVQILMRKTIDSIVTAIALKNGIPEADCEDYFDEPAAEGEDTFANLAATYSLEGAHA